jgi:bifunctional non-homologous end joining protein LigD
LPSFIPPQLPKLITTPPHDEAQWIHEIKYDGYRIQTHLENGLATFFTRNGHNWSNKFPHLLNAIEKLNVTNAIFDGEIVAMDQEGRSHFQLLQNSLKNKSDKHLRYYVFDILFLNGKDLREKPLWERKELLQTLIYNDTEKILLSETFPGPGSDIYNVSCEYQLEGIVSKLADAPYRSGRNDLWVKTKCSNRQEFVIGGWSEPQGGRNDIGALLLGIYEGDKFRYVGRVGSGLSRKALREVRELLNPLERKTSPFKLNSPSKKGHHWVKPIKVCEVSFTNWTQEGLLRTPVFIGLREDKMATNITKEVPDSFKEVTSPEKIIFLKEKITKGEILKFYEKIAKHMLTFVSKRPLSIVRCPNGTNSECFFQKHLHGQKTSSLHPLSDSFFLDSRMGLQELVQLNAIEIHTWNCLSENMANPDQIVMDFDPGPDVSWKEVVEAAFKLKSLLEDLDLKSFVKLTGGKGVHIHIPIAPIYEWTQVKSFAKTLALEMISRDPDRFTANMSKKHRNKKIFIDYLRNGEGATAIAPYSLRAKEGSAVALPIEWSELKRSKSADQYSMNKALRKISSRKRDPWNEMKKLKQQISILRPSNESEQAA